MVIIKEEKDDTKNQKIDTWDDLVVKCEKTLLGGNDKYRTNHQRIPVYVFASAKDGTKPTKKVILIDLENKPYRGIKIKQYWTFKPSNLVSAIQNDEEGIFPKQFKEFKWCRRVNPLKNCDTDLKIPIKNTYTGVISHNMAWSAFYGYIPFDMADQDIRNLVRDFFLAFKTPEGGALYYATFPNATEKFKKDFKPPKGNMYEIIANCLDDPIEIVKVPSLDLYFQVKEVLQIMNTLYGLPNTIGEWKQYHQEIALGNFMAKQKNTSFYNIDFVVD